MVEDRERRAPSADALLSLDRIDDATFLARDNVVNFDGAIFGGQFLAQAAAAAGRTVGEELDLTSVHAHFLRRGDVREPVRYRVVPLRSSAHCCIRRTEAWQAGEQVFEASCAFSTNRAAAGHAAAMPAVVGLDDCTEVSQFVRANAHRLPPRIVARLERPSPLERRLIDPDAFFFDRATTGTAAFWVRIPGDGGGGAPWRRRALLAFLSDGWAFCVALSRHVPIAESAGYRTASLNHALWVHSGEPTGPWYLMSTETPQAGGGRGIGRVLMFDKGGKLVASAVQEGLMIAPRPRPASD